MAQSDAPPSTLIPRVLSPEDAAKRVEGELQPAAPKVASRDPKGEELYEFSISVTDGAGNTESGKFKNKILTIGDRIQVGLTQSFMVGRTPWEVLDADTQWLVSALAHLSISLVEKPEWFRTTMGLKNVRSVQKVYAEVAAHEQFFRGTDTPQETGA